MDFISSFFFFFWFSILVIDFGKRRNRNFIKIYAFCLICDLLMKFFCSITNSFLMFVCSIPIFMHHNRNWIHRIVMIFIDVVWLSLGVIWLVKFYIWVQIGEAKEIMLGMCICVSCFDIRLSIIKMVSPFGDCLFSELINYYFDGLWMYGPNS